MYDIYYSYSPYFYITQKILSASFQLQGTPPDVLSLFVMCQLLCLGYEFISNRKCIASYIDSRDDKQSVKRLT